MDRFEGFGKSTPLNPRLRNRWVYKRSSWQRKATYNCGLYYQRWTGTWSSLDIYGHEVLRLPPYHCDLNAIELIWANEKNFVARENKEMTLESVEKLFHKRRAEITVEMCKKM